MFVFQSNFENFKKILITVTFLTNTFLRYEP
jgi:hypothetical protein